MVFGLLALIGIVSTHQLLTNYESIKNRLLSNYNYSDLNEDNINIKSTNKKMSKVLNIC